MSEENTNTATEEISFEAGPLDDGAIHSFAEAFLAEEDTGDAEKTSGETVQAADDEPAIEAAGDSVGEEAPKVELISPQLANLARREKALRAREATIEAQVQQQVAAQLEAVKQMAMKNPSQFFKQLGVENTEDLAAMLWADKLGDDAPDTLKNRTADARMRQQMDEMKKMQADFQRQQQDVMAAQQRDQYVAHLNGFLSSVPADMPYLQAEYESDPAATLDALCVAASNLMESGTIPNARDVGAALEKEIASIAARYSSIGKPKENQTTAPSKVSAKPSTTLSESTTSGRTSAGSWDIEQVYKDIEKML